MGLVQAKIESAIETSPQLIESLHSAREIALKSNAPQVLPVHLTLAMLDDDESSFLLEAYGVDFDKTRQKLLKLAQQQTQPTPGNSDTVFSPAIEELMQHARQQAQKNALGEVDSNLILAVMLSQKNGFLANVLQPYDLDTSGVLQYLELREGKTVNIDPLPEAQKTTLRPAMAATPSSKQKPVSVPTPNIEPTTSVAHSPTTPQAPLQPPPQPFAASARPAPPILNDNPTTSLNGPTLGQQQVVPSPHNQQAREANPAMVPNSTRPPIAPPPSLATPPVSPPALAAVTETPVPVPVPLPPSSQVEAPDSKTKADEATPSRLRSMMSGFKIGGNNKAQKIKTVDLIDEPSDMSKQSQPSGQEQQQGQNTSPTWTPQQRSATSDDLSTNVANNNRNNSAPSTNIPPSSPSPQEEKAVSLLSEFMQTAPQSVDTLINSNTSNDLDTNGEIKPFIIPNRPAKRRRAIPDSLGAHESISATGSVLEKGRLLENVPRRMKINQASKAEVRITRAHMDEIKSEFEDLSSSHFHELAVTEAMTVQLRAPGGGFHIENLSPQTQWIDRNQRHINDADFGAWRWNVTPTRSGKARLQLVISARTVDDDGTINIADIPDKIIELGVNRDHAQIARKAGLFTLVATASLALGRYGESAAQWISILAEKVGG